MVLTTFLSSTANGIIWPSRPTICENSGLISCFKNIQQNSSSSNPSSLTPSNFIKTHSTTFADNPSTDKDRISQAHVDVFHSHKTHGNPSTSRVNLEAEGRKRTPLFISVAFNYPKADIFTAADERGRIFSFFVSANRYALIRHIGQSIIATAFNPNRKTELLVTCQDLTVRCIDVKSQALISTLRGHRQPATSVSFQQSGTLALSASTDAVVLWDTTEWSRFRTLNAGPGVVQAQFICDGQFVAVCFRDDSILAWDLQSLQLKYRFVLPGREDVSSGLTMFSVSRNSIIASGRDKIIYVWELESQTLIRIIQMPPSVHQILQISFLPETDNIVGILSDDGKLNFLNISASVPKISFQLFNQAKPFKSFTIDSHGKYVAACTSDGCILLYDLDIAKNISLNTKKKRKELGLPETDEDQILNTQSADYSQVNQNSLKHGDADYEKINYKPKLKSNCIPKGNFEMEICKTTPAVVIDKKSSSHYRSKGLRSRKSNEPNATSSCLSQPYPYSAKSFKKLSTLNAQSSQPLFTLARLSEKEFKVNKSRLVGLYSTYREYPSKYRLLIWRFQLQLPENRENFDSLVESSCDESFLSQLRKQYPIQNQRLFNRLAKIISGIICWTPIYSEVKYLPEICFPFVKLFGSNELAAFETCLCILLHWGKNWLETFPHPPLTILSVIDSTVAQCDQQLHDHFMKHDITVQDYAWPMLSTVFTEVFLKNDWLKLWDYLITFVEEPALIYIVVISYLHFFRDTLLSTFDKYSIQAIFHHQNSLNFSHFMNTVETLRRKHILFFLNELHSKTFSHDNYEDNKKSWCLPKGKYPIYHHYPKFVVNYQLQERERIAAEEAKLTEKRKLLNELEAATTNLQKEHEKRMLQKEVLFSAEEKRRSQACIESRSRLLEQKTLDEEVRRRRLNQLVLLEKSAKDEIVQSSKLYELEHRRYQDELEFARERENEMLKSRQDEEKLLKLEFDAMQRIKDVQRQQEIDEKKRLVRFDYMSKKKKKEYEDMCKIADWEREDKERQLYMSLKLEKEKKQMQLDQEIAWRTQLETQYLETRIEKEKSIHQIENERYLRKLKEDEKLKLEKELELRQMHKEETLKVNSQIEHKKNHESLQVTTPKRNDGINDASKSKQQVPQYEEEHVISKREAPIVQLEESSMEQYSNLDKIGIVKEEPSKDEFLVKESKSIIHSPLASSACSSSLSNNSKYISRPKTLRKEELGGNNNSLDDFFNKHNLHYKNGDSSSNIGLGLGSDSESDFENILTESMFLSTSNGNSNNSCSEVDSLEQLPLSDAEEKHEDGDEEKVGIDDGSRSSLSSIDIRDLASLDTWPSVKSNSEGISLSQ